MITDPFTFYDWRFVCPQCSRFVRPDQVISTDHADPSAYYGVSTDTVTTCSKCGPVDDFELVCVGERVFTP